MGQGGGGGGEGDVFRLVFTAPEKCVSAISLELSLSCYTADLVETRLVNRPLIDLTVMPER